MKRRGAGGQPPLAERMAKQLGDEFSLGLSLPQTYVQKKQSIKCVRMMDISSLTSNAAIQCKASTLSSLYLVDAC